MARNTSVRKAICIGLVTVNGPVLPLLLAPMLMVLPRMSQIEHTQGLGVAILLFFGCLISGLPVAWAWWSFSVPRWRLSHTNASKTFRNSKREQFRLASSGQMVTFSREPSSNPPPTQPKRRRLSKQVPDQSARTEHAQVATNIIAVATRQPSPSKPERDALHGCLLGRARPAMPSSLRKISSSWYPAQSAQKKTGRAKRHAQV